MHEGQIYVKLFKFKVGAVVRCAKCKDEQVLQKVFFTIDPNACVHEAKNLGWLRFMGVWYCPECAKGIRHVGKNS